ncbi:MAG: hypothetical protein A2271_05155 [Candidatus Moranbacteria bacterium RIFOXYA12_FULL_35_19]|nr:MAG: hypothetical protein UR78_C0018G0001 [Candidatus Moranbacteria bacterium GW2011_GWF2_35_39]OGI30998.1 MAG: hypothetical protein A2343_01925 [Candidatus Moranbacteria bacterium RIFOXYB12_FULL_35_8]OGI32128.1 MAG: hypothetical protein A2489_02115 [Candidatus Moranbacteria bacterium RIFOXYC12_FULL_36_13]OGI35096.1 MAG: hypothetical protein A2271_05155 [Candidatus Moranbacteria bacterium RIFOXYA12_FULL_35_19]
MKKIVALLKKYFWDRFRHVSLCKKNFYEIHDKLMRRGCYHEDGKFFGCDQENCPKDINVACRTCMEIFSEHLSFVSWFKVANKMPMTGRKIMKGAWSFIPRTHL